jgi:hypothetical protein
LEVFDCHKPEPKLSPMRELKRGLRNHPAYVG